MWNRKMSPMQERVLFGQQQHLHSNWPKLQRVQHSERKVHILRRGLRPLRGLMPQTRPTPRGQPQL